MSKIILFIMILFSPLAMSSEVLSSPIEYDRKDDPVFGGFDVKIKSSDGAESLVGSIIVSNPSEIDKKSSSPIYSVKVTFFNQDSDAAYFYIDFSTKGVKKVGDKSFDTYFFIRDVVEVNKSSGSRFNVGGNIIIFSPI